MTRGTPHTTERWAVARADVSSGDAQALLRAYFTDVANRYCPLYLGREVTSEEIESVLADWPSGDLIEPTGLFLIGRYRGEAQSPPCSDPTRPRSVHRLATVRAPLSSSATVTIPLVRDRVPVELLVRS